MGTKNMRTTRLALLWVTGLWGCAHGVRPDSMSAEEHRQQADKDLKQAHTEVVRAAVAPPIPPPPLGVSATNPVGYAYPLDVNTPSEAHLMRARQLEVHAHQHQNAAKQLEGSVQDECKGLAPETRASCPMLGPVTQVADVAGGVKVTFAPQARVESVAAQMRCHFAYAQAHGFDTLIDCPLYVRGLKIQVTDDGQAIELTGPDARTAEVIRARSREEVRFVRQ